MAFPVSRLLVLARRAAALVLLGLASWAAAAVPLTGRDPGSALGLNVDGGGEARRTLVPASHPGFDQAVRVEVTRLPARVHQVQLTAANLALVKPGDVVRVSFALRAGAGEKARAQLFVQNAYAGFTNVAHLTAEAGPQWREFALQFEAAAEFYKNELRFNLFLGDTVQTAEIGGFRAVNLGPRPDAAAQRLAAASAVVREDFEGAFVPVAPAPGGSGARIRGALPAGWEDDSVWSRSEVDYAALTRAPYAGKQSLEMTAQRIPAGRAHLVRPLYASAGHFIRLSAALRSPTSATLRVQLRQRGAPYTVYGEASFTPIPEWGVMEAVLPPPAQDDPNAILIFALETPGRVEFDDIIIAYQTPEAALSDVDTTGNLLAASSWPLGVTYPWFEGGNERTPEANVPDPAVIGPTGQPALRLTPYPWENRVIAQITTPFVGRPGEPHTFSFWAKAATGGRPLAIRMGPPSASLWRDPWQKTVQLDTEWRRYSFTVTLPVSPEGFYLARINTHERGVFWIDGAQVVVGPEPGEFRRSGAVELALRADEPYGLHHAGEPLRLTLAAWGDLGAATELRGTLVDPRGAKRDLPPVPVAALRAGRAAIAIPPGGETPLGTYVVTYTAHDGRGAVVSKPTEVLLHRVRPARAAGRVLPSSPFGTHAMANEAAVMKKLGFNWLRALYLTNWATVEPRPGQWKFDRVDAGLRAMREANLAVMSAFGGVPRWASYAADEWTGANPGWWRTSAAPRPEFLDAWQAYAREMMRRYRDVVLAWETWNEPFLPGFFPVDVQQGRPVRGEPALLVEMARRVHAARREAGVERLPLIWNTGSHYGESEAAFDAAVKAGGKLDLVDQVSIHKYLSAPVGFPGDEFEHVAEVARRLAPAHTTPDKLWNSEGGRGPSDLINAYRALPPFGRHGRVDTQADGLVRYYVSNFAAGIGHVFSYNFYPDDGFKNDYTYMNVGGALSPVAPAFANLAWQLEGRSFAGVVPLPEGVNAYLFRGADETVAVLLGAGPGRLRLDAAPAGLAAADLYGNEPAWPARIGATAFYLRGPGLDAARLQAIFGAERR